MNQIPEKIRISHILLSWDGAINSTHSRELLFAIHDAKMLIADLWNSRISWHVAVKEHSACRDTVYKDGDLGWFMQHEVTSELWNAGVSCPIGGLYPEPVDSPYGVHIIRRTG